MRQSLFGLLLLFFSPAFSFASDIMFEGYYRVELEGKHIGYSIIRYSFDSKKHVFETATFLHVHLGTQTVQESLKAKADDKFHPLSYQYTSQVTKEGAAAGQDEIKMIDATFKGEVMTTKNSDGKKVKTEVSKVPKGTFLSSFLPYLLLQKQLKTNESFRYSAIAEEDAGSFWGTAVIASKEKKDSYSSFLIKNKFKGDDFTCKMAVVTDPQNPDKNIKGEVFAVDIPLKNISQRLVNNAAAATDGQPIPNKTLMAVFDGIPLGKVNMLAAKDEADP